MSKFTRQLIRTLSLVLFIISLQGCASTSDRQRTENEGSVVGAVIGGVLGLVLGGNKKSAIIGSVVGVAIGNMYGKHVADKKEEYKNTESYMEAMIAESDKVLVAAKNQRVALTMSIEQQKMELARLSSLKMHESASKQKIKEQIESNRKDLEVTGDLIAAIDREIRTQKKVVRDERNQIPVVYVRRSQANISSMGSEKRQLELLKAQLASLDHKRVY